MNDRMRELIALVLEAEPEHGSYGRIEFGINLAELIVRECADFVSETATIETLLGDRLKEHFGVEE